MKPGLLAGASASGGTGIGEWSQCNRADAVSSPHCSGYRLRVAANTKRAGPCPCPSTLSWRICFVKCSVRRAACYRPVYLTAQCSLKLKPNTLFYLARCIQPRKQPARLPIRQYPTFSCHPAAIPAITSPKKNDDATYPSRSSLRHYPGWEPDRTAIRQPLRRAGRTLFQLRSAPIPRTHGACNLPNARISVGFS